MSIPHHPMTAPRARPARFRRHWIGVAISAACIWLMLRGIDLEQLQQALAQFHWNDIWLGVASLAIGYLARIRRWATLLRAGGAHVSDRACAAPFMGSIALNNVMPLRAGDLVRAFVFPSALGIGRVTATASLVLERLVDLLTLLACVGIALALQPGNALPPWLAHSVLLSAAAGGIAFGLLVTMHAAVERVLRRIASGPLAQRTAPAARAATVLADLVRDAGAMSRPRVVVRLALYSVVVWAGETGLFWAVLRGVGLEADGAQALFAMALATLSTLVPSSPGYVGPFHLAAWSAALMLGGTPAQAASFALLAHLGLWLPTTLAGAVAILARPDLFRAGARSAPAAGETKQGP